MRWVIMSIFDVKANGYTRPFFSVSKEVGLREVSSVVNDSDANFLARFPEDYSVFCLGYWDDDTGGFDLIPNGECLCRALDLKRGVKDAPQS